MCTWSWNESRPAPTVFMKLFTESQDHSPPLKAVFFSQEGCTVPEHNLCLHGVCLSSSRSKMLRHLPQNLGRDAQINTRSSEIALWCFPITQHQCLPPPPVRVHACNMLTLTWSSSSWSPPSSRATATEAKGRLAICCRSLISCCRERHKYRERISYLQGL